MSYILFITGLKTHRKLENYSRLRASVKCSHFTMSKSNTDTHWSVPGDELYWIPDLVKLGLHLTLCGILYPLRLGLGLQKTCPDLMIFFPKQSIELGIEHFLQTPIFVNIMSCCGNNSAHELNSCGIEIILDKLMLLDEI